MMSPRKVARIAGREFASTAITKGFIIGALVVPAVIVALIPLIALLSVSAQPPADKGTVYVLDRSGEITPVIEERLAPEKVKERWADRFERASDAAKGLLGERMGGRVAGASGRASDMIRFPEIRVVPTAPDADPGEIKDEIRGQVRADGVPSDPMDRLLALVEVDGDAATIENDNEADDGADDGGYGAYQVFFRPKLNEETVGEIEGAVRWSIRERRYANAGLDRDTVSRIHAVEARQSKEITAQGERDEASEIRTFVIPVAAMLLLIMATMTGGQYLLTTTIEEKANRVVEVLLSACSPMELMTGKIVGQMGVGLTLLVIYNALGIVALVVFERLDLIGAGTIVLFFVFFLLAYFMFASLMAAIGSAVNDLRESQSLMTPVILLMMLPYFFFMPVVRAPNSMLSTVTSFIPPISPFIMIMRVASTDPPPAWQIALAIAVNAAAVVFFLWLAAKIFRVGLLMFGKPPNFRTLIRWVRMA